MYGRLGKRGTTTTCALGLLLVVLAACSSSKPARGSEPGSTVPIAAVQTYTRSVCGSLLSLRTISRSIEKFMPSLRNDSVSRIGLKGQFETLLRAASTAATAGSDFLGHAPPPTDHAVAEHERGVRDAMAESAREYERWRGAVARFDVYDRDNWEDELLTLEHNDMTGYGQPAWQRIFTAVTSGAVGAAVQRAAGADPVCAPVFSG